METIIRSQHVKVNAVTSATQTSAFWKNAEAYRFGIIPMLLVVVACMGGLSAGFGAKGDAIKLALLAFPTILMLAFMLAVAPMRLIIWSSVIAVLLQIAVLIF